MSEYRYFRDPLLPKSSWRSGPDGIKMRYGNVWGPSGFRDLDDLLGPQEQDLESGDMVEVDSA